MSDFIETYDQAISPELCQAIIERFEQQGRAKPGQTGHGIDRTKKDSLDVTITNQPDWRDLHDRLLDATLRHLLLYLRKYRFALTSGVALTMLNPATGEQTPLTPESIDQLTDPQLGQYVFRMFRPGAINLQKYKRQSGGYHYWHSEIYPRDPAAETLHRVLLFMFYLNTVEDGGETEFFYQQRKLRPTAGQMVIAPAGFTHTHKGHVPLSNDKYIATSWILFQRAEVLFQNPQLPKK